MTVLLWLNAESKIYLELLLIFPKKWCQYKYLQCHYISNEDTSARFCNAKVRYKKYVPENYKQNGNDLKKIVFRKDRDVDQSFKFSRICTIKVSYSLVKHKQSVECLCTFSFTQNNCNFYQ